MNDAREHAKYIEGKVEVLPAARREQLNRASDYDLTKLMTAFSTRIWEGAEEMPEESPLRNELLYLRELYQSGEQMNEFYNTLSNNHLFNTSYGALVNEADFGRSASIMSGFPRLNLTDEARIQLKLCIEKLLDPDSISEMVPERQDRVITFHTSDDRAVDYHFTRDAKSKDHPNMKQAMLWQAVQFHGQLFFALIQLAKELDLEIISVDSKVDSKIDLNPSFIQSLPDNLRATLEKLFKDK